MSVTVTAGDSKALLVVRVRGTTRIRSTIADTMKMMNVHAANNLTVLPATPVALGMLKKAKDYVTWGEADRETLLRLLREKATVEGQAPLADALKETPFGSLEGFVDALLRGEARLKDVPGLRPTLRMNPPRQGWGSIKRAVRARGSLGYRGADINDVVTRMLDGAARPEAA